MNEAFRRHDSAFRHETEELRTVLIEIRKRDEVSTWLAAGLCLSRVGLPAPSEIELASAWVLAALSELPSLPPVGVVADVGRLVTGASGDLAAASVAGGGVPAAEPRLKAAVRAYEDQLLGRLGADPRLEAASDAIARLPGTQRPAAVSLLTGYLLERIGYEGGASISPATARKAVRRPAAEILRDGFAALRQPGRTTDRIAEGYEELVKAARQTRALLGDREIFALENLDVLGSHTRRVAAEQILSAAEELERTLPRRLKRGPSRRGATPTQLEDESAYPIGGFSSMATNGSIENLVTSELIYMDDTSDQVDLFDMRYVEGELLYYTRDESIFVRRRHVLTFVIPAELEDARVKDPEVRWQRLTLSLGLVLCSVRRLCDWLSDEGLLFRVVFLADPRGPKHAPLAEERSLCELLLREWIDRGVAKVEDAADLPAALRQADEDARTALSDVVLFGVKPPAIDEDAISRRIHFATLLLDHAQPFLAWHGERAPALDEDEPPWQAWAGAALDLLQAIV